MVIRPIWVSICQHTISVSELLSEGGWVISEYPGLPPLRLSPRLVSSLCKHGGGKVPNIRWWNVIFCWPWRPLDDPLIRTLSLSFVVIWCLDNVADHKSLLKIFCGNDDKVCRDLVADHKRFQKTKINCQIVPNSAYWEEITCIRRDRVSCLWDFLHNCSFLRTSKYFMKTKNFMECARAPAPTSL